MKTRLAVLAAAACLAALPASAQILSFDPLKDLESAIPQGAPNEARILQARAQVREVAQDALAALYEVSPGSRRLVERSAGYAVFSTFGVKLFFAGGNSGKGMVVNNRTGRQTFMRMLQVQGGLGFGIAKSRFVFVFTSEPALKNFISQGWEFGAQGNLSAVAQGKGGIFTGAASIAPNVLLFQITETGLAATLTVAGTKFFLDNDLN